MSIALVAGLGNPGRDYELSRHNLGWMLVEALARKHGLAWRREPSFEAEVARWDRPSGGTCWLVRPLTFMNESGRAVGSLARYHRLPPESVAAVYDDLTIEAGRLKVSVGGGPGGHNGVASLLAHLGDGFVRYRVGIGPRHPPEMDLKDYVLARFGPEQLAIIQRKTDHYIQGLELLLTAGPDQAMNQLNRKDP
jgi:peptidyl-tRNA hydrolase, PTH1 family